MDVFAWIQFTIGIALLVFGARLLVFGAARMAVIMGVSPLVIGLTVVAFGTGSPELAVGVRASLTARTNLALGNVIGSNICNILFIIGMAALVVPLSVRRRVIRWDVPIMIGVSLLLYAMATDRVISRLDGAILSTGIVVYSVAMIWASRISTKRERAEHELESEVPRYTSRGTFMFLKHMGYVLVGLGTLVIGSHFLVEGASAIARGLGFSELIIGLTIVALGTSLPEGATTVVACLRGESELALGNAIGSNIFNISAVLGVSALLAPNGIAAPRGVLSFDLPVMIAVAVACLPIAFTGGRINRGEGALFLAYYVVYVTYLFLVATRHEDLPIFNLVMLAIVIPLTVIGIGVTVLISIRDRRLAHKQREKVRSAR